MSENTFAEVVSRESKGISALQRRVDTLTKQEELLSSISTSMMDYASKLLSNVPVGSSARRSFRSALHAENARLHEQFVAEFEKSIVSSLDSQLGFIEKLEDDISECIDRVSVTRESIGTAVEQSLKTNELLHKVKKKLVSVQVLMDLFVINKEEAKQLISDIVSSSGSAVLDVRLLDFIEQVERKRGNCRSLMSCVPNSSQLAIDCLSESVEVLELVYEKIFFALTSSTTAVVGSTLVKRALHYLKSARPHYYSQAVDSIVQARANMYGQRFVRSSIELEDFDTVQYVSNLMSWAMESFVEEKSFWEGIVDASIGKGTTSDTSTLSFTDQVIHNVAEMIFTGRVVPAVQQTYSMVDLFRILVLLEYYANKLGVFVRREENPGQEPPFKTLSLLEDTIAVGIAHYQSCWTGRLAEAISSTPMHVHLHPLPIVSETAFALERILGIYFTDPANSALLEDTLSLAIDPLIPLCERMSTSTTESHVFMLNCLSVIRNVLQRHDCEPTRLKLAAVQAQMQHHLGELVNGAAGLFLKRIGISELALALRNMANNRESGSNSSTNSSSSSHYSLTLTSTLKSFYNALITQGIGSGGSHLVDLLTATDLRALARERIAVSIANAYEGIFRDMTSLGLVSPATHSPDQVRTLLDLS